MRCYVAIVACTVTAWQFGIAATVSSAANDAQTHESLGDRFAHRRAVALLHASARRKLDKRHVAGSSETKAADASSEMKAADLTADASSRRPIITGCLKECGYEEQTCVTQCQVCIEQNECRILGKCDPCLREAHAQRVNAKKIDKGILDSGGIAMVRDGLLAEMTRARLEALDRLRELRVAREGVLKAQREAEWAAEERHMSAKNLQESRQVLKGARLEVTRWKLQNEKKLKAMRAKAREQRQERQKAERKLEAEKLKYSKAQRRLRIASANTSESGEGEGAEDGDEVWRLAREVEEHQEAVERAEKDVESTTADGEWLDRGLRRRVKGAQTGARQAREELLEARARERVSRERLDEAKDHYVKAVKASQWAEKAAQESEKKLRKAPVSAYPAANSSAVKKNTGKELRGSASYLRGGAWIPLLVLLTVSRAVAA